MSTHTLLFNPCYTSPVAKCPIELLDAIFLLTLPTETRPVMSDSYLRVSLVLSHVCMRWRAIALSNSRLWNRITLKGWNWRKMKPALECAEEMVARSRRVPVSLYIWIGEGWDESLDGGTALLLESVMPRLRVLELRIDCMLLEDGCVTEVMRRLRGSRAPLLESLSVAPFSTREHTNYASLNPLFSGGAPKLHRLDFSIHLFLLDQPSLSNVTHFRLHSLTGAGISKFTCTDCLKALRKMPLLEELSLSIIFDSEDDDSEDDSDNDDEYDVELSHLKYLHLDLCDVDCTLLVPWLTFPPGCVYDITCNEVMPNRWYESFLAALELSIEESQIDMSDKALIIEIHSYRLQVVVLPDTFKDSDTDEQIRPCFSLTTVLRLPDDDEDYEDDVAEPIGGPRRRSGNNQAFTCLLNLARFIRRSKLTQARSLYIGMYTRFFLETLSAPVLGPLLRECKNAERLVLTGTENGFLFPIVMWMASARRYEGYAERIMKLDELLFAEPVQGRWDPMPLLNFSHDPDIYNYPTNPLLHAEYLLSTAYHGDQPSADLNQPERKSLLSKTLKTIRVRHAEYDVDSKEVFNDITCSLWVREILKEVVDGLVWPVCSKASSRCNFEEPGGAGDITMRDMMDYYLEPPEYGSSTPSPDLSGLNVFNIPELDLLYGSQ